MLGGGFRVVELGDRQYVASVPKELDRDSNTVMQAAQVGIMAKEASALTNACKFCLLVLLLQKPRVAPPAPESRAMQWLHCMAHAM